MIHLTITATAAASISIKNCAANVEDVFCVAMGKLIVRFVRSRLTTMKAYYLIGRYSGSKPVGEGDRRLQIGLMIDLQTLGALSQELLRSGKMNLDAS